jgi:hypothetical protein
MTIEEIKQSWRINSPVRVRILVLAVLCTAVSGLFFRDLWFRLPRMLSPSTVFGSFHAAPWGVLMLCILLLAAKRKSILEAMRRHNSTTKKKALSTVFLNMETVAGAVLVIAAIYMHSSDNTAVFRLLLAWLGVFLGVFGVKAAGYPAAALVIY